MKAERGGILFKLAVLMFLAALCGAIYLLRHPILRFAGNSWVTEDPLERADALLVLSDDNFNGDRAARAAQLFQQAMAPVVVASGRRLRSYAGIGELMEHDLEAHGVPKGAILVFAHTAESTREEAEQLRGLASERGWRRVIVVTSNVHARRARYIYRRVFPPQVDVRVGAAADKTFDPDSWWENRTGVKQMFLETVSMTVAMWELRRSERATRQRNP